jgi:adenylate cyclase
MTTITEIESTVSDYLQGDYEVTDAKVIPSVDDVPFGKQAKKMNMCVFFIDLRKSTDLLFLHEKQTAGKIHKAFLYTAATIVRNYDGYIRSFNGDSLLAFWPAFYKSQINRCVKTAQIIKWLLDVKLSPLFEKYEKIDFGIGIDWGEVFIVKAGLPRDTNNNDLIFMGRCVNYAVAIGEQAKGPCHVEISISTFQNLEDEMIYAEKEGKKVNMWQDGSLEWQEKKYETKLTSWYWPIG